MTQRSTMGWSLLITTVLILFILPGQVQSASLWDLIRPEKSDESITLESHEATDFLRTPPTRIKRHTKWYQHNPDFQAWYKYYQKIGHNEGLYEIDRIRSIYLQMRHLENVHGKNAPYYQYTIGVPPLLGSVKGVAATSCDPKTDKNCKSLPPAPKVSVAKAPPAPVKTQYPGLPQLSCNPQDPSCLLQYFYHFMANAQADCDPKADPKCSRGVRALPCDPKYDPACAPSKLLPTPDQPGRCNPHCDEEEGHGEDQRPTPAEQSRYRAPEDAEGSEDEEETGPYDPHDPARYGYRESYYDHYNPHGNPHEDSPYGNPGEDSPYGSPGEESPYGNPGEESPYGNPHEESPYGNPGEESPYGYPREESPYGDPGEESPYGDPGEESPYGYPGRESPYGNPGRESPYGYPREESPYGNPYEMAPYGNPSGNPYGPSSPYENPYEGSPYGNPYGASPYGNRQAPPPYGNPHEASPYTNPYGASPYGNPYGRSPYETPYGPSPYGSAGAASPYGSPYGAAPYPSPYGSRYAAPYDPRYRQDGDEEEEEEEEEGDEY